MSMIAMDDPSRLLIRAGALILAGALVSLTYRLASPATCDPTMQVVTFSGPSVYDTATECRAYEHGRLLVLDRSVYRRSLPFAVAAMAVQWLLVLPAIGIILKLSWQKSRLSLAGLSVLALGVAVWLASAITGINRLKTVEPTSPGDVATRAAPEK